VKNNIEGDNRDDHEIQGFVSIKVPSHCYAEIVFSLIGFHGILSPIPGDFSGVCLPIEYTSGPG
jgi:hypothetical protein